MKTFNPKWILTALLASFALSTLNACNDDSTGDKIDEAAHDAGRAAEDAVD